ncbi:uncharacterized protein [Branchiostoma lanceolatum]|uniref:uncharacterized protein isoform X2 n=1 Tax=Branchiostoma lanceolatum TaxID=7740 RepID=UPI0034514596
MASVEGVTIRPALFEDLEKILQIDVAEEDLKNKEFDDLKDDLEDEDDFDDDETYLFLAETETEVIGFGMMEDIDKGGQGGIIVDMRVARTWRDAGIYEMMYEHLIDFAKKEEDIKYIRTSVNKFPEGTDVKEICKVEYIAFEGDVETLRETLKSVPAMEELPLSSVVDYKQRHMRLMLRPGVGENILTNGFFFADGDTYTLCKDNLYEVDEDSCVFVDNNKPIQSISFGSDVETDRAALYTIEVNTKNIELMKSHILKQMQSACVVAEGQIVFSVLTLGFEDEIRAFLAGIEGLEEAEQYKESVVWSKIPLNSD